MKKILIILLMFVLVGCAPAEKPMEGTIRTNGSFGVSRYFDKEAGVVCWIYYDYKAGGISCLPIEDTLLEMPK